MPLVAQGDTQPHRLRWRFGTLLLSYESVGGAMSPSVARVFARVNLQTSAHAELAAIRPRDESASERVIISGGPDYLGLHVSLSAEDSTGRHIHTLGRDFGMGGPRRVVRHSWSGPPLPSDPDEEQRIVLGEHRVFNWRAERRGRPSAHALLLGWLGDVERDL